MLDQEAISEVATEVQPVSKEVKIIETYSFFEFCQEVQKHLKQGWSFDFDSNEHFPSQFGALVTCGLVRYPEVKVQVQVSAEAPAGKPEQDQDGKPVVKRRTSKA
jgi:hypothetical protein